MTLFDLPDTEQELSEALNIFCSEIESGFAGKHVRTPVQ
jgi:hypothetical protein